MNPQTHPIESGLKEVKCLLIISNDPRQSATALEGMRCAMGLSADSRWDVTVGFCENANEFLQDFSKDPSAVKMLNNGLIQRWSESGCAWYCLFPSQSTQADKGFLEPARILSPSQWLRLGMEQSHILLFDEGD
ncbi:MAG: hypothetical protein HOH33_15650 [Verrucomicrobia bacterium]|mgnify:CR=1 FL=1|jgi:hypothetical protein|nr:hypothetical protein [Verrucomicrobiota bacterium]